MSFIVKRDSISAILNTINPNATNSETNRPIGKAISRPTKSIMIRQGTKEQQIIQLETELRHAHMQLEAERARAQEMQQSLHSMINEKFEKGGGSSSIIERLQNSQSALRSKLQTVIQSKMDLCEETAKEIDRLRTIIRQGNFNAYVPVNNNNQNFNQINKNLNINSSDEEKNIVDNQNKNNNNQNNNNNNNDNSTNTQSYYTPMYNGADDGPFPHGDRSRIDLRTIEPGDGMTLPNPFASVDLKYVGFIVDPNNPRDKSKWQRFIDEKTSETIFETKLGNNENIIGLEQAVLSMSLGEKAMVWVPSRLGYGTHGASDLIPPNADIVFQLQLVNIQNDHENNENDDDDENISGSQYTNDDDDEDEDDEYDDDDTNEEDDDDEEEEEDEIEM